MMNVTKEHKGTIKLGSKIMVSDPCYGLNTWCQGTINNVLPGIYNCFVEYSDEGDWGTRVSAIEVIHQSFERKEIEYLDPEDFEVGVDSGQAGIFDYEYYEKFHSDCEERPHVVDEWYDRVCGKTITLEKNPKYEEFQWRFNEPLSDQIKAHEEYQKSDRYWKYNQKFDGNIIDNLGFVSSSGYGDGGYYCWTAEDDNNNVIAIRVEFITEDYDEEE